MSIKCEECLSDAGHLWFCPKSLSAAPAIGGKASAGKSLLEENATLTADLARLTADLERKQRECEGLREALERLCKSFPTDADMVHAGWESPEIDEACVAYDHAMAALAAEKEGK